MDSMADAITFGVAPAVLGFAWGFQGVDTSGNAMVRDHLLRLGYFVCFLYLLSGCARLSVEGGEKPIHIVMDINIKIDQKLDQFFAFEEQTSPPTAPTAG